MILAIGLGTAFGEPFVSIMIWATLLLIFWRISKLTKVNKSEDKNKPKDNKDNIVEYQDNMPSIVQPTNNDLEHNAVAVQTDAPPPVPTEFTQPKTITERIEEINRTQFHGLMPDKTKEAIINTLREHEEERIRKILE